MLSKTTPEQEGDSCLRTGTICTCNCNQKPDDYRPTIAAVVLWFVRLMVAIGRGTGSEMSSGSRGSCESAGEESAVERRCTARYIAPRVLGAGDRVRFWCRYRCRSYTRRHAMDSTSPWLHPAKVGMSSPSCAGFSTAGDENERRKCAEVAKRQDHETEHGSCDEALGR
jgi:hypothetical protein